MSLILEALKKSEAERRVGQPPGLLTQVPNSSPVRRNVWPWLGLLLVPALVGAAWWFGRTSAPPVPVEPQSEPVAATATTPASPQPHLAPQPVVVAAPPAVAPRPQPRPAAALREAPPSADDASAERESAAVSATEGEAMLQPLPAPPPAPAYTERTSPPEITAPVITTTPAPVEPQALSEAQTDQDDVPQLRDFDAALRAELPPLRASMHVYDADPARRFVLIDGRRASEGDVLGESLLLIEIRRDGSVLEFRGRRFLLPRPG